MESIADGPKFDASWRRTNDWGSVSQKCPKCEDGWCKLLQVKKDGDNQGKEFWSCPKPNKKYPQSKGCGFFCWFGASEEEVAQLVGAKRARHGTMESGYGMPAEYEADMATLRARIATLEDRVQILSNLVNQ